MGIQAILGGAAGWLKKGIFARGGWDLGGWLKNKLLGGKKPGGMGLKDMAMNQMMNMMGRQKKPANNIVNTNSFFGRQSQFSPGDDAPDVFTPDPLMDSIGSSILPPQTIVPNLESFMGIGPGVQGIIAEIYRINRNIDAIRDAMLQSAIIENDYRKQLIADMEQDLAERGKKRSGRRNERNRFNFFNRAAQIQKGVTKVAKNPFGGAALTALGLELAAFGSGVFRGDKNKNNRNNNKNNDGDNKGNWWDWMNPFRNKKKNNNSSPLTEKQIKQLNAKGIDNVTIQKMLKEPDGKESLLSILSGDVMPGMMSDVGSSDPKLINNIEVPSQVTNMMKMMGFGQESSDEILNILTSGELVEGIQDMAITAGQAFNGVMNEIDSDLGKSGSLRSMIIDLTSKARSVGSVDDDAKSSISMANKIPDKDVRSGIWQGYLSSGER